MTLIIKCLGIVLGSTISATCMAGGVTCPAPADVHNAAGLLSSVSKVNGKMVVSSDVPFTFNRARWYLGVVIPDSTNEADALTNAKGAAQSAGIVTSRTEHNDGREHWMECTYAANVKNHAFTVFAITDFGNTLQAKKLLQQVV